MQNKSIPNQTRNTKYGGMNMLLAILNWLLLAFLAICNAAWIRMMLSRSGKCTCRHCPFADDCPMQRRVK